MEIRTNLAITILMYTDIDNTNKTAIHSVKSCKLPFLHILSQYNIWERFTLYVSPWEHCGTKLPNPHIYITGYQHRGILIRVQT